MHEYLRRGQAGAGTGLLDLGSTPRPGRGPGLRLAAIYYEARALRRKVAETEPVLISLGNFRSTSDNELLWKVSR